MQASTREAQSTGLKKERSKTAGEMQGLTSFVWALARCLAVQVASLFLLLNSSSFGACSAQVVRLSSWSPWQAGLSTQKAHLWPWLVSCSAQYLKLSLEGTGRLCVVCVLTGLMSIITECTLGEVYRTSKARAAGVCGPRLFAAKLVHRFCFRSRRYTGLPPFTTHGRFANDPRLKPSREGATNEAEVVGVVEQVVFGRQCSDTSRGRSRNVRRHSSKRHTSR